MAPSKTKLNALRLESAQMAAFEKQTVSVGVQNCVVCVPIVFEMVPSRPVPFDSLVDSFSPQLSLINDRCCSPLWDQRINHPPGASRLRLVTHCTEMDVKVQCSAFIDFVNLSTIKFIFCYYYGLINLLSDSKHIHTYTCFIVASVPWLVQFGAIRLDLQSPFTLPVHPGYFAFCEHPTESDTCNSTRRHEQMIFSMFRGKYGFPICAQMNRAKCKKKKPTCAHLRSHYLQSAEARGALVPSIPTTAK